MLSQIKMWAFAIAFAAIGTGWMVDRYYQYEKGYNAAVLKQNEAIVAYQGIVVENERKHTEEVAKLATEHTKELDAMLAAKPIAQEKIRVITKTIDRPAACNLQPDELRVINEAIRSANGSR